MQARDLKVGQFVVGYGRISKINIYRNQIANLMANKSSERIPKQNRLKYAEQVATEEETQYINGNDGRVTITFNNGLIKSYDFNEIVQTMKIAA